MKTVISALVACSLLAGVSASMSFAQQSTQEGPEFPKGFEGFLSDMAQLMKKYPLAAETFSLRDSSAKPKPKSSHHACCEWSCDWGSVNCKCNKQCLE
jgi:hypothetical protein